jgi:hypothetical protein
MIYEDLNEFTKGYIDAMFWTECDDDSDEELQKKEFLDLASETLKRIIEDCAGFELNHQKLLEKAGNPSQNGHDFWLTRNGHGAGFWDRGYGAAGLELTNICHDHYPSLNLVLGNDGYLYLEG